MLSAHSGKYWYFLKADLDFYCTGCCKVFKGNFTYIRDRPDIRHLICILYFFFVESSQIFEGKAVHCLNLFSISFYMIQTLICIIETNIIISNSQELNIVTHSALYGP